MFTTYIYAVKQKKYRYLSLKQRREDLKSFTD